MLEPARQRTTKINKLVDSVCKKLNLVGFEIFTVMAKRNTTFWKVTPDGR
jgi:hypothetical protein